MDVTLETGPKKAAGEDVAKSIQPEAQYCIAGPRIFDYHLPGGTAWELTW